MVASEGLPNRASIADRPSAVDSASWSKQDIGLTGGSIVEPAVSAYVQSDAAPTASRQSGGWEAQSDSESNGAIISRFPPAGTLSPQCLVRREIREHVATLVADNSISRLVDHANLRLSQYCIEHSELGHVLIRSSDPIDEIIQWIGLLTTFSFLEREASALAHDAICLEDIPATGPPSLTPDSLSVSPSGPSLTAEPQLPVCENEIHFDGPPGPPLPTGGQALKKKAGRGGVYKCVSCRKAKIRVCPFVPPEKPFLIKCVSDSRNTEGKCVRCVKFNIPCYKTWAHERLMREATELAQAAHANRAAFLDAGFGAQQPRSVELDEIVGNTGSTGLKFSS